jgi:hypothetical protein
LVCKNCHGKATKIKVFKERLITGEVIGHRTIKLKVGYKKTAKKATRKTARTKR